MLQKNSKRIARKIANLKDQILNPIKSCPLDDGLDWIKFINPGMLSKENIDLFAHCIERLPSDSPVLEIGSFSGLSLNHIIYLLRRNGRGNPVFSTDEWKFEGYSPGQPVGGLPVVFEDYREHVRESFRRNVKLFSGDRLPHHLELGSDAFFELWSAGATRADFFGNQATLGGPISFAYIDGDHTYEQSRRDFDNVDRFLEPGGFIIFDDSGSGKFGCSEVAAEAAALQRYELVARHKNYCVRKRSKG